MLAPPSAMFCRSGEVDRWSACVVGTEPRRRGVAGEGRGYQARGNRWIADGNGGGKRVAGARRMRAELTIACVSDAMRRGIVDSKQTLRDEQREREQADVQDAAV